MAYSGVRDLGGLYSGTRRSAIGALPQTPVRNELLGCRTIETQEARGIVVQNVALLFRRQVLGVLNHADRVRDQLRPDQLIGAKHHAVLEAAFNDALNVMIHFLDRI